jgi:peptidoglycan/xylan/chitin deacetylase (PgdA/CDA1 family)
MKKIKMVTTLIIVFLFIFSSCSNNNTEDTIDISLGNNTDSSDDTTTESESPTSTPTETPREIVNENSRVPILMYHSITDDTWGYEDLHVSPSELEKQVKYLSENGYTTLFFEELEDAKYYEKPIILTFDDGYKNNYTEAYPILEKYKMKGTIFFTTSALNKKNKLTEEDIKNMDENYIEIQSHTVTHLDLSTLDEETLEYELKESKEVIEELTGKEVNTLCYPAGKYNDAVLEMTEKYYTYGVKARPNGLYTEDNPNMEIERLYVSREMSLDGFINLIEQ